MALPALQEALEHLSAETRKRPAAVARTHDVVSFEMAEIINIADEAVRHLHAVGLPFVEANRFLADALGRPVKLDSLDPDEHAEILVRLKRSLHDLSGPSVDDVESIPSFVSLAETLRSYQGPQPSDPQLAYRQAERIEESAKAYEAQKVRFLGLTHQAVAMMEAKVAGHVSFEEALRRAITRQSIERYPVINEYLAS